MSISAKVSINLVQMKPKIGDINHNAAKILEYYKSSHGEIVLFPELCLTGYSPRDDMLSEHFIEKCYTQLNEITKSIGEKVCIISLPYRENGKLYNACFALRNQQIIGKSFKSQLPNYGIFEEKRYFTEGVAGFFEYKNIKFGMPICEDIWHEDVCYALKNQGVQVFLVPNASPFHMGKIEERVEIVQQRFKETGIPLIYCNQVACQDGIIYDGTSFIYDGCVHYCSSFAEETMDFEWDGKCFTSVKSESKSSSEYLESNIELLYDALIFGLKEYVTNSGFQKIVIGLSGGADSALVAYLAVEAFGKDNVQAVLMPSHFTTQESVEDAKLLAENLELDLQIIAIDELLKAFQNKIKFSGVAAENIQARIRGNILMTISNQTNAMVLTTGNKSEIAVGYCTIYGDMCGGYNPIIDLYKTEIFSVMKWINVVKKIKIPSRIITKEPSAELKDNQKDSDSLPNYEILDKILIEIIEKHKYPEEILAFCKKDVNKVWNLIAIAEYKRNQSANGTRISRQSLLKNDWKKNTN